MMNDPAQISPRQTADSGRQSSGAKSGRRRPASEAAPVPARAKKKSWPILEVVIFLLLVKITVGAAYFWSKTSALTPTEADLMAAAAGLAESAEPAAPAKSGPPVAAARPEAPVAAAEAPAPQAESKAQTPPPPPAEPSRAASLMDGYLSVVSPAVAEAQAPAALPASSISAVSAGALMVIGGHAGAPAAGQEVSDSIPLPPGGNDLLQPVTGPSPTPAAPAAPAAPAPVAAPSAASQLSLEDQVDQARLRSREQDLTRREVALNTREEALTTLEAELNRRLSVIETSRSELEGLIRRNETILEEQKALADQQQKEAETLKDARIQHLVTAYGGMKPEQAGTLVNSLDDDVAVSILAAMPGRKAGQILAYVIPDKAARLTKAISEMRIDPNLLMEDPATAQ